MSVFESIGWCMFCNGIDVSPVYKQL